MLEPLTVLRTSRKALPGVNFCVRGAPTTAREDRRSWDRVKKTPQVAFIYPGMQLPPRSRRERKALPESRSFLRPRCPNHR